MPDQELHLLVELDRERTAARRRETFLMSAIVHLLLILLIVTNPELFEYSPQALVVEPKKEVTMLYQPPEPPKLKAPAVQPAPEVARQEAPKIETPPPPRLSYRPEVPPPAKPPRAGAGGEDLMARGAPPIGLPDFRETLPEPPKQRPALEPVRPPEPPRSPSQAKLLLPTIAPPSRGTDALLQGMAKEHAAGGGPGIDSGVQEFDPNSPEFSMPGPQILSDTMGVDFNPYLLRIYLLVRRNWYSVIPEIARLGKQGRVVLQFSILRNGAVPDLTLTLGSGTESLDTAALASIRLSNPFPALPQEFPGNDIRLRFTYLYNLPIHY